MSERPRNSTKAIIIQDGCLLTVKCRLTAGNCIYILPGGGQEYGETLTAALVRECREELGADIVVGSLAFVREYIAEDSPWGNAHQVEFYFHCTLVSDVDLSKATEFDSYQEGIAWLPLTDLCDYTLCPEAFRNSVNPDGSFTLPPYIGAVD